MTASCLGSISVLTDGDASAPQGFECQEIPLARVDDLVPETDRIAVVKIGAGGSELDVFQGMDRILSVDRPVILVELNSTSLRDHRGAKPKELTDLLFGYDNRVPEATSVLAGQPAMVGEVPMGAQVFANIVCFPA